jgi:hypothetical protein
MMEILITVLMMAFVFLLITALFGALATGIAFLFLAYVPGLHIDSALVAGAVVGISSVYCFCKLIIAVREKFHSNVSFQSDDESDDLEIMSDSFIDLLHEKRYADAEKVCERMQVEYPEQEDGWERLGMLRADQARWIEAAQCYRRAAGIMRVAGDHNDAIKCALETAEKYEGTQRRLQNKKRPGSSFRMTN